jgi:hypothetical protein
MPRPLAELGEGVAEAVERRGELAFPPVRFAPQHRQRGLEKVSRTLVVAALVCRRGELGPRLRGQDVIVAEHPRADRQRPAQDLVGLGRSGGGEQPAELQAGVGDDLRCRADVLVDAQRSFQIVARVREVRPDLLDVVAFRDQQRLGEQHAELGRRLGVTRPHGAVGHHAHVRTVGPDRVRVAVVHERGEQFQEDNLDIGLGVLGVLGAFRVLAGPGADDRGADQAVHGERALAALLDQAEGTQPAEHVTGRRRVVAGPVPVGGGEQRARDGGAEREPRGRLERTPCGRADRRRRVELLDAGEEGPRHVRVVRRGGVGRVLGPQGRVGEQVGAAQRGQVVGGPLVVPRLPQVAARQVQGERQVAELVADRVQLALRRRGVRREPAQQPDAARPVRGGEPVNARADGTRPVGPPRRDDHPAAARGRQVLGEDRVVLAVVEDHQARNPALPTTPDPAALHRGGQDAEPDVREEARPALRDLPADVGRILAVDPEHAAREEPAVPVGELVGELRLADPAHPRDDDGRGRGPLRPVAQESGDGQQVVVAADERVVACPHDVEVGRQRAARGQLAVRQRPHDTQPLLDRLGRLGVREVPVGLDGVGGRDAAAVGEGVAASDLDG